MRGFGALRRSRGQLAPRLLLLTAWLGLATKTAADPPTLNATTQDTFADLSTQPAEIQAEHTAIEEHLLEIKPSCHVIADHVPT